MLPASVWRSSIGVAMGFSSNWIGGVLVSVSCCYFVPFGSVLLEPIHSSTPPLPLFDLPL